MKLIWYLWTVLYLYGYSFWIYKSSLSLIMQPSMGTLNSPSSRIVKDLTPSRRRILRCINFDICESSSNLFLKHGESLPSKIRSTVNLERTGVFFLFYYFIYLKVNLDLEKTNQLGESSLNLIFAAVNLDPFFYRKKGELMANLDLTILLKRWTEVKTWGA